MRKKKKVKISKLRVFRPKFFFFGRRKLKLVRQRSLILKQRSFEKKSKRNLKFLNGFSTKQLSFAQCNLTFSKSKKLTNSSRLKFIANSSSLSSFLSNFKFQKKKTLNIYHNFSIAFGKFLKLRNKTNRSIRQFRKKRKFMKSTLRFFQIKKNKVSFLLKKRKCNQLLTKSARKSCGPLIINLFVVEYM